MNKITLPISFAEREICAVLILTRGIVGERARPVQYFTPGGCQ